MDTDQEEYLKGLGKRIQQIRKDKNMTQQVLSMDSDIPISQISAIENGRINTTVASLKRIAKVLEVPLKSLFDFEVES